jgi:N-acetylglutamate synthase-like GNAT family acetyltransferase
MEPSNYPIRRATLDDLPQLTAFWQNMRLPVPELSKRITEFQVIEGPDGNIIGMVGLQVAERQARIHSEVFADFTQADQLRPLLWERIQSVAKNHGLLRLWTREKAPFWTQASLVSADAATLEKLPVLWKGEGTDWLTLKLKDDVQAILSLDKEFALFMESEKQRTHRAFQHARILKLAATLIALTVFLFVMAGAFILIKKKYLQR